MVSTEIITAAASFPITLTELKTYCRVDTSSDDDMLNIFIAAATGQLEQYCNRKFINTTIGLHLDGFGAVNDNRLVALGEGWHDGCVANFTSDADYIELPFRPVQSVTSIKTYDTANTEATFSSASYRLDINSGLVYLNEGYTWPSSLRARDAVLITYVAGYGANAAGRPRCNQTGYPDGGWSDV